MLLSKRIAKSILRSRSQRRSVNYADTEPGNQASKDSGIDKNDSKETLVAPKAQAAGLETNMSADDLI